MYLRALTPERRAFCWCAHAELRNFEHESFQDICEFWNFCVKKDFSSEPLQSWVFSGFAVENNKLRMLHHFSTHSAPTQTITQLRKNITNRSKTYLNFSIPSNHTTKKVRESTNKFRFCEIVYFFYLISSNLKRGMHFLSWVRILCWF